MVPNPFAAPTKSSVWVLCVNALTYNLKIKIPEILHSGTASTSKKNNYGTYLPSSYIFDLEFR